LNLDCSSYTIDIGTQLSKIGVLIRFIEFRLESGLSSFFNLFLEDEEDSNEEK
jgi:hypothetical protein